MAAELDAFLKGSSEPQSEALPPPAAVPEPEPSAAIPGMGTPEPEAQAKADKPDTEDDAEPPEPQAGEPVVPRRALEDERHKRQDWKAKAIEAETKRAELERQLNEAKRAAAAPAPQPPPRPVVQPEIPNPAIDPAGYHAYVEQERLRSEYNQRLNFSEMLLRKEIGSEKVDAAIVEFQQAAARDPSLIQNLYLQPDPYSWAYKQLERLRLQSEIGDDPAAWREAERERLRAEIAASAAKPSPPVSPAAGQQPSLANARSVATRSAPAFTGPPSLEDILAGVPGRQARH